MSRAAFRLLVAPGLVLAGVAALLIWDRERGFVELARLAERVRDTETRVSELEREKNELRMRARGLRAGSFEVETVARESLGMMRPGERVIRLAPPVGNPQRDLGSGVRD